MTHWRHSNQSAGQPHSPIARSLAGRPHAAPSFIKPPLESAKIREAIFDVAALFFAFLFVSVTGLGFAFAVFVVLFIET